MNLKKRSFYPQSELQAWDSWEADENKQKYNQNGRSYPHANQRQTSHEEEPEPDYFTDMVPKIKKQKKVIKKIFNFIL